MKIRIDKQLILDLFDFEYGGNFNSTNEFQYVFQSYIDEKLYLNLLTPEMLTKVMKKRGLI